MEKNWNQILLENFAVTIGSSLDELRNEYDDMIKTFELQRQQLRIITTPNRNSEPINSVEVERTLSSTPSYASCYSITTKEGSKKKKAKHMSFRVSGSSLRKRLSHKTVSPCPPAVLDRTESKRSVNSQSSDYGSTSKSKFKNDRV